MNLFNYIKKGPIECKYVKLHWDYLKNQMHIKHIFFKKTLSYLKLAQYQIYLQVIVVSFIFVRI